MDYLESLSLENLKKFEGIGRVKAIQIKAAVELARRLSKDYELDKIKIKSPKDVFNVLANEYFGKKQEILKVVILNKQNKIMLIHTVATGNTDSINIGVKECLSEPIKNMANAIILNWL